MIRQLKQNKKTCLQVYFYHWTPNRLCQHGLSDKDECTLYAQEVETLDHLLNECVYSREMWFSVLCFFGFGGLLPTEESPLAVWWLRNRKLVAKIIRKGFDALVWLVAWSLWREQSRRVHERAAVQPVALAQPSSRSPGFGRE
jgi:hypothetical protein